MDRIAKLLLIATLIGISYVSVYNAQTLATAPPCCRNLIGTQTCSNLNRTNYQGFIKRCNNEIDFRVIQCCQMCDVIAGNTVVNSIPQTYDNVVQKIFANGTACFDRMGAAYCKTFAEHTGTWQKSSWSCGAQYAPVAFRICRLSCGYCSASNTSIASVPLTSYTQTNAYASCGLK